MADLIESIIDTEKIDAAFARLQAALTEFQEAKKHLSEVLNSTPEP